MSVRVKELRRRISFLERNLVRGGLATAEQVAAVVSQHQGRSTMALVEQYVHLKALAINAGSQQQHPVRKHSSDDALQAAVHALSDQSHSVHLPSLGHAVTVTPASYARINAVEDHEWWMLRLLAARMMLVNDAEHGTPHPATQAKVCTACQRPLAPGKLKEVLAELDREIMYQRSMLYANVVAETPAPVTTPVSWADQLTSAEDALLRETWHRINYEILSRLPQPTGTSGSDLPRSWAFLFAHQADRERRSPVEIMRNRSLASLVAVVVLETIRDQTLRAKGKVSSEQMAEAFSS
jgi:hypothetical protein